MKKSSITTEQPATASSFFADPLDWIFVFGLLGSAPMLAAQAMNLWTRPHFQFFPFAWIAFAFLIIRSGKLTISSSVVKNRVAVIFIAISLAVLAFAVLLATSPWLTHFAVILLLLGWMQRRLALHWYTSALWSLLLFVTLPLPTNLDTLLINWLQAESSQAASSLLDLAGTVHLLTGNVIEIRHGKLFVDQACSGVGSLYALTAIYVLIIVWQNRSLPVALVALISVPCWSWFGNVVRLFVIALSYDKFNINLTSGWQHQVVGLSVFALVIGCFLLTFEAISMVFRPLRTGAHNDSWTHKVYNWFIDWPKARKTAVNSTVELEKGAAHVVFSPFSISLSVAFGLLGVASFGPLLGLGPWKPDDYKVPNLDLGNIQARFTRDLLPNELEGIQIRNFELTHREENDFFGEYSATWFGVDTTNGKELLVSLDFPFPYFHPLEICYESTGHTFDGISDYELESSVGMQFVRVGEMKNQFEDRSKLFYMEFAPSGRCDKFQKSFFEIKFGKPINEALFQLQVLVTNSESLTAAENEKYRSLLLTVQKLLLPAIQSLE